MVPKKEMVYTRVPEPVPGSFYRVNCVACGTDNYSMTDMNNHKQWCALAKKMIQDTATKKAKSQHHGNKHR